MAYTDRNFKTKKEFKEAVAKGIEVRLYNPSGIFPTRENGREYVEGPHGVHKWYASVTVKDGVVTKVE